MVTSPMMVAFSAMKQSSPHRGLVPLIDLISAIAGFYFNGSEGISGFSKQWDEPILFRQMTRSYRYQGLFFAEEFFVFRNPIFIIFIHLSCIVLSYVVLCFYI